MRGLKARQRNVPILFLFLRHHYPPSTNLIFRKQDDSRILISEDFAEAVAATVKIPQQYYIKQKDPLKLFQSFKGSEIQRYRMQSITVSKNQREQT